MRTILLSLCIAVAYSKPAKFQDPMINEGLFEGDIMGIDTNQDRNAVPRDSLRWPNGIAPYVEDSSLFTIRGLVEEAIRHIEDNSCIRFVRRTNERNYLKLFKGDGCWSFWGMEGMGEQKLSLGGGCGYFGTVVHELLHALGFEHEHNRSDRDDFLTINWENIDERFSYAFNKLQPHENRLLTDFDYDSLMLYGEKAFAKWGVKSMSAKDGRFLPENHNKPGMSSSDMQRLNMLYNCPKK